MSRTVSRRVSIPAVLVLFSSVCAYATNYAYDGAVSHDVKRDRIIAIGEDHATLYYYVGSANIDYSGYWGALCPDATVGWKTGMKYCWGGEDTTQQYLTRMGEDDGAGNKDCSGGSSYDQFCAGADCSGFVSNAWTCGRYSTASFHNVSDNIQWEQLRQGDALNNAGSHIRLFDYFLSTVGTAMLYESTSGGGTLWKNVHRSLSRDNNYQPIRYNGSSYGVYDYPTVDISYMTRTGVERLELRWDGEADLGFNLYVSSDGSSWSPIRDSTDITNLERTCEVSGLLPDHTYFFKMTAENSGGETADSDIVTYRLDVGSSHRVLLVDGYDRYTEQHGGACHNLLPLYGKALAESGVGYDFCSNEKVVDELIDLADYEVVVWMLGEESTFDETFSWPEQMHVEAYLDAGGRLFVSGAEIGWDLDYKANDTTWKNGSSNDQTFYNSYLLADYSSDDANTYHVSGIGGTIFAGLDFYFDDGTHGIYGVPYPDVLNTVGDSTAGLQYQGGTGGNAAVYGTYGTAEVVNFGFPFETIYPESSRVDVMTEIMNYFDFPVQPPNLKSVLQTASDTVTIEWDGYASEGFRLSRKTGAGSWSQIKNESTLGSSARSTTVVGLSAGTRYAFKLQAVNSSGASADSDVMVVSLGSSGNKILIVDGYDRWNAEHSYTNHVLLEYFADALTDNSARYDSCANETVTEGDVLLSDYDVVMWLCGEESTAQETASYDEQVLLQGYLQQGGKLFMSGAEIGWDLIYKADSNNDYSNGSANDTPFYNNYLKANYENDDAGTYAVTGVPGTDFEGLSFGFDNGTHGTYDVDYPDVLSTTGGSANALYYSPGTDVAGITFTGTFPSGTAPGKLVYFGFPFETIYDTTDRSDVMGGVLSYFGETDVTCWRVY